ncbi:HNH endonuclease family protein [Vibrio sp.]|nr:HNH endonuclease family protein [Vibrio sp.]
MKTAHLFPTSALALVFIFPSSHANEIKKTKSGLCHEEHSSYYERIKNYTPYSSIDACLESGGRLPKKTIPKSSHSLSNEDIVYSREKFGYGWGDEDKDCQNTRMEVLIHRSQTAITFASETQCRVISGQWVSYFTNETLYDASEIDIDHVVPLKWAWLHGANTWDKQQREAFANHPDNLIVVEASLNRSKGAKDPTEWLPPKNQCQYIAQFLRLTQKHQTLSIPQDKMDQLELIDKSCIN